MIALNEILSKKDKFEQKYKLMKKNIKLDNIIKLEEKFIVLDKKANEIRSKCNKLCGEFSKLIESDENTSEAILEINKLDKYANDLLSKSQKSMKKINSKLKKLPNPALDDNVLNISLKTKPAEYLKTDFISELEKFSAADEIDMSEKNYYSSLKKVVLKAENLPKIIKLSKQNKYILMCKPNDLKTNIEKIQDILTLNAKYLVVKSIQHLVNDSSKTLISTLSDGTNLTIDILGEYVSREYSIKFYDKNLDMTQFVNMIRIIIK